MIKLDLDNIGRLINHIRTYVKKLDSIDIEDYDWCPNSFLLVFALYDYVFLIDGYDYTILNMHKDFIYACRIYSDGEIELNDYDDRTLRCFDSGYIEYTSIDKDKYIKKYRNLLKAYQSVSKLCDGNECIPPEIPIFIEPYLEVIGRNIEEHLHSHEYFK